jgi:hypothetical protein
MPQRQNQVKIKSDEVQGEGSFVIFRRLTFGQTREFGPLLKDENKYVEGVNALLTACVAEWNWVDDAGKPLALPSEGLDLNTLANDEILFLINKANTRREPPAGPN